MTKVELGAIALAEANRGIIKNKKKYHPIICDIVKMSINSVLSELVDKKNFGIEFIHTLAIELTHAEQNEFMERIKAAPSMSKTSSLLIYQDIILQRGK